MKTLPQHLFVSSTDGALYDTRRKGWPRFPLRPNYSRNHAAIVTVADLKATLRAGPYTGLGGYPLYFITADGAVLSFDTVRKHFAVVASSVRDNDCTGGWRVVACEVNWEDTELICEHSGKPIESAYGN